MLLACPLSVKSLSMELSLVQVLAYDGNCDLYIRLCQKYTQKSDHICKDDYEVLVLDTRLLADWIGQLSENKHYPR